jgi:hypothetical protein
MTNYYSLNVVRNTQELADKLGYAFETNTPNITLYKKVGLHVTMIDTFATVEEIYGFLSGVKHCTLKK